MQYAKTILVYIKRTIINNFRMFITASIVMTGFAFCLMQEGGRPIAEVASAYSKNVRITNIMEQTSDPDASSTLLRYKALVKHHEWDHTPYSGEIVLYPGEQLPFPQLPGVPKNHGKIYTIKYGIETDCFKKPAVLAYKPFHLSPSLQPKHHDTEAEVFYITNICKNGEILEIARPEDQKNKKSNDDRAKLIYDIERAGEEK